MNTQSITKLVRTYGPAVGAEFFGTLLLIAAVIVTTLAGFPAFLTVPVALIFIAFTLGPVSGAYVNPALVIGSFVSGYISWRKALVYVIAEIAAGFAALGILHAIPALTTSGALTQLQAGAAVTAATMTTASVAEVVALIIFGFGVSVAIANKQLSNSVRPVIVGLALFLAILISIIFGGSVANPAIAISMGGFSKARLFAPIIGSIVGFVIAKGFYSGK